MIQFTRSPEKPQEHPLQWGIFWQYIGQREQSLTSFSGLCLSREEVAAAFRLMEDPHGRGG